MILVTGGAGFIGSSIARRLLRDGEEVRILDNLLTGFKDAIPDGTDFLEGDIRDLEICSQAVRGCSIVFHQAALPSVARSVEDPLTTNAVNIDGTLNILKAALDAGCERVVYASSSSVYGNPVEPLRQEISAPAPISPYAVSKLGGELYCNAFFTTYGFPTFSLRYFNVFGPGQSASSKYAAVFPSFVSALLQEKPPQIQWDGEQTRDFTYIDDVVEANILASKAPVDSAGQAFNVGTGRPKSIRETLEAVSKAVGIWVEPESVPKRTGDIRNSLADLTRSENLLNYRAKSDWDIAVSATVEWFRS